MASNYIHLLNLSLLTT